MLKSRIFFAYYNIKVDVRVHKYKNNMTTKETISIHYQQLPGVTKIFQKNTYLDSQHFNENSFRGLLHVKSYLGTKLAPGWVHPCLCWNSLDCLQVLDKMKFNPGMRFHPDIKLRKYTKPFFISSRDRINWNLMKAKVFFIPVWNHTHFIPGCVNTFLFHPRTTIIYV